MAAFGPDGFLYVTLPKRNMVVVLPDLNGDGVSNSVLGFARRMKRPHGLVFTDAGLVVAENGRLVLLNDWDGNLQAESREVLTSSIPVGGGHTTRTVVEGPDNGLYVSVGSSCNVCMEKDSRRAAVLRFSLEGEGDGVGAGDTEQGMVWARGLRNSVGLAFHPDTAELWGVDNGRDMLGDDLPPEELNRITLNSDYGWPHCYGNKKIDPDFGSKMRCARTTAPMVEMQAHSAPLGIAFGRGLDLPNQPGFDFSNMLLVAFHGSWNRSAKTGYKLVGIPFEDGLPVGPPVDIISGWLTEGGAVWGRPVAPVVGPDGALYLTDDYAGTVYRIARDEGE
jgi:glucose/arabinose dehydrogenase